MEIFSHYSEFFDEEKKERIKKYLDNPPELDIKEFEKAELNFNVLPKEVQLWWMILNDEERVKVLEFSILFSVSSGVDPNNLIYSDILSGIETQFMLL